MGMGLGGGGIWYVYGFVNWMLVNFCYMHTHANALQWCGVCMRCVLL